MRGKTYRRFSTEFKPRVVEAYLAGEGSLEGLATKAGVDHSLVHYWLKKCHAGELSLDAQREEAARSGHPTLMLASSRLRCLHDVASTHGCYATIPEFPEEPDVT